MKEKLLELIHQFSNTLDNNVFIGNHYEIFPTWEYNMWGSTLYLETLEKGGGHLNGVNKGDIVAANIQLKDGRKKISLSVITKVTYPSTEVSDMFKIELKGLGYLKENVDDEFKLLTLDSAKHM